MAEKRTIAKMQEDIRRMKQEQDVCLLAHSYEAREVVEVADFTGDSYQLSVMAGRAPQHTLLFCGREPTILTADEEVTQTSQTVFSAAVVLM